MAVDEEVLRSKKEKDSSSDESEKEHKHKKHKKHKEHKDKSKSKKLKKEKKKRKKDGKKEKRKKDEEKNQKRGGSIPEKRKHRRKDVEQISDEDYYRLSEEFKVWIRLVKKQHFEDFSSQEAQTIFSNEFVTQWNEGELNDMYYDGIPDKVRESLLKTRHTWGFVKHLSDRDQMLVSNAVEAVSVTTRHKHDIEGSKNDESNKKSNEEKNQRTNLHDSQSVINKSKPFDVQAQKRRREMDNLMLEEFYPKETGREAKIAKKNEISGRIHSAAKNAENSIDGLDGFNESDVLGGGGKNEFQQLLQKKRMREEKKNEFFTNKIKSYEEKENERIELLKQTLNLQPNQKIQIRPRNDTNNT